MSGEMLSCGGALPSWFPPMRKKKAKEFTQKRASGSWRRLGEDLPAPLIPSESSFSLRLFFKRPYRWCSFLSGASASTTLQTAQTHPTPHA
jgi:hypothetical protein